MSEQSTPQHRTPRPAGGRYLATATALLTVVASVMSWLQADDAAMSDRGSDSSEKAYMVILAVGLGTAVSVAAIAFVATKTALFK